MAISIGRTAAAADDQPTMRRWHLPLFVLAGLAMILQLRGMASIGDCQQLNELMQDAPPAARQRAGFRGDSDNDDTPHNAGSAEGTNLTSRSVASPIVSSRMLDFPLPRLSDDYLVVMVLSRRDSFATRTAIRNTWARNQTSVYFVVGQPCDIPKRYRGKDDGGNVFCKVADRPLDKAFFQETLGHREAEARTTRKLLEEQAEHRDLLMMHDIDMYRTLPAKLKFAYSFVDQYLPDSVRWVLKVDDDFFVRVDAFRQHLQEEHDETYRSHHSSLSTITESLLSSAFQTMGGTPPNATDPKPVLLGGDIRRKHEAHVKGKWKEMPQWPRGKEYPPFPLGSYGHAVTRPLVEYVAQNQFALFDYQGEDNSMGIWFAHPSAPSVEFRETQRMKNHGNCRQQNVFVVGHDVTASKMRVCAGMAPEAPSLRKARNAHRQAAAAKSLLAS